MKRSAVLATIAIFLTGCAPGERIPKYPHMSAAESLDAIETRNRRIKNISGEGAITLIDATNRPARFDAAFVFSPPESARVRGWKFGQAVLDLTIRPDGIWLYVPRRDDHADDIRKASSETGRALREWLSLLFGDLDAEEAVATTTIGSVIVTRPTRENATVRVVIDRATLTPRRYELLDHAGSKQFELLLSEYHQVGDVVWPARIEAKSGDGRRVIVELRDVELDVAPSGALEPPQCAERLP